MSESVDLDSIIGKIMKIDKLPEATANISEIEFVSVCGLATNALQKEPTVK